MINIDQANQKAVDRLVKSRPVVVGVGKAKDVIPGRANKPNLFTHAGPPINWDRMCGPMRGAVAGAMIYEGLAKSYEEAAKMCERGEMEFAPCHHYRSAGPMAGVISPNMSVYIVEDKEHGGQYFSGINEGRGKVLRMGAYSQEVLDRYQWMENVLAPVLDAAIKEVGGIDIRSLIAEALGMGDECHNRCKAASLLFLNRMSPGIVKHCKDDVQAARILEFMGTNELGVLNPIMAACKAMADAAHGVDGSTIVTAMARNGTDFGMRVSGLGDRWFTAAAPKVDALYFPGFTAADANPDIGDSTIMETVGIGGFAMAAAPAIVTFVGGSASLAIETTKEMYEITTIKHPVFTIAALDFEGTPTGTDIRKVVEKGVLPRVNTGVAHKDPGIGQVGAGLVKPPMSLFEDALVAFAEKYDF